MSIEILDTDAPANPFMLLVAAGDMYKAALRMASFPKGGEATCPVSYPAFVELLEAAAKAQGGPSLDSAPVGKPSMGEPADQCAPPPQPPPPTWFQVYAQRHATIAIERLLSECGIADLTDPDARWFEIADEFVRQNMRLHEMVVAFTLAQKQEQEKRNARKA